MRNSINLLPALYRRQQMLRRRAIQWGTAILAVLVVGWGSHWFEVQEQKLLAQRLDVLKRDHQPTRTKLQQLVEMRQKLESLKEQEAIAHELEYQRSALVLLGVLSESARETEGRLRITKLNLENLQSPGNGTDTSTSESQSAHMLVSGVSLDYAAVSTLMKGLQDSKCFSHVELLTSTERETGGRAMCDYELRCEF